MRAHASFQAVERLLAAFEVNLQSFAICEIGRGWRLACPEMDSVLVHYVLKGEGALEYQGETVALAPNMVVVAPRRTIKHIVGAGRSVGNVASIEACEILTNGMLNFKAFDETPDLVLACGIIAAGTPGAPGPFDHLTAPVVAQPEGDALPAAFSAMLCELANPGLGARLLAEALMKQCLLLLMRDQMRQHGLSSPLFARLGDPRLARAVAEVLQRPENAHSVADLAKIAGMSRTTFAAVFMAQYDITPGGFVNSVRLQAAARMLRLSQLPVKVVAGAVGYASRSQFSRSFKAEFGVDPTRYRSLRDHAGAAGSDGTFFEAPWKSPKPVSPKG